MGMFDHVDIKLSCPMCGQLVENFQTKDKECRLELVPFDDTILSMIGECDTCEAFIEIDKTSTVTLRECDGYRIQFKKTIFVDALAFHDEGSGDE